MTKIITILWVLLSAWSGAKAQSADKPFIRLLDLPRETNTVRSPKQYISGATCKSCRLTINGDAVKVYATGGFAYEMDLKPGENVYNLVASSGGDNSNKRLVFRYSPIIVDTVKTLDIASIDIWPQGNLVLKPGDKLKFRVKALTGCKITANGTIPLYELPINASNSMPGIYQGEYILQARDSFAMTKLPFTISDSNGKSVTKRTESRLSMVNSQSPDMLITKGRLAHLLFGLGEDRLGGAKMGYIDSLIPLQVTGKIGSLYRVQLSKYRSAYIPDDVVDYMPKGSFSPGSLTGSWRVYGDSTADYVSIGLFSRLPYQTMLLTDPTRIVLDIFGATNNTNWITQLENTKEITDVYYEQVEDEVLRVTIKLRHTQQWGHQVYYKGNNLVVRVRRQPENLQLKNLLIAVDAGHGGGNTGASGPTGSSEKELALAVSQKLRKALQYQGARVIMTRNMEKFVDNKERILLYRDSLPDLLISIHLNSSSDPIHVGGTSTYFRYPGFRQLSLDIYKRMLELGLSGYGNTGSFNFMLNSPVEYPNALVEMLFISNPAEEMLILDEKFQQSIADKIVLGIRDFLERCRQDP